ncbi:uncharacterized protein LOC121407049 [Lytechinus variegatus]|uniref:uncharacterized protein LOC121407049 n=1 Tax=Lytechinus variegatus TaxID=7654 RepID=UPI001BB2185C|nr:uncharacterized protein LOC121407049 [Lytechinus variegatus]XP_041453899.1 uncharacterized protein LOC121407049 [Lytechinus variegatus]
MAQVFGNHQDSTKPQETCIQNGETMPCGVDDDEVACLPSSESFHQGSNVILSQEAQQVNDSQQSNGVHVFTKDCTKVPLEESKETPPESNNGEVQSNEKCAAITHNVQKQDIESDRPPSDGIYNTENVKEMTGETVDRNDSNSLEDVENEISPMEVLETVTGDHALSPDKPTIQADVGTETSLDDTHLSEIPDSHNVSVEKEDSQEDVELEISSVETHKLLDGDVGQTFGSSKEAAEDGVATESNRDKVSISCSQTRDSDRCSSGKDIEVEDSSNEKQVSMDVVDIKNQDTGSSSLQEADHVENSPSDKTHLNAAGSKPIVSQTENNSIKSKNDDNEKTSANDDEDEDIIVVSESHKSVNKKPTLTTVFKCVRCGQISKSRSDLNIHLLKVHKLIIVSKQKSVDCLFCSKSLEMAEFYQHLRTEHKVLLVKNKDQNSDADKTPGEKNASRNVLSQDKSSSPKGLIDLTVEDQEESGTSSDKQTSVNKKSSTSHSVPSTSKGISVQSNSNRKPVPSTSKETSGSSTSNEAPGPSTSMETALSLRRTPRRVTQRKYTEVATDSSSSDDNDPVGAPDDDDDDDYDPNQPEYPHSQKSKSPSKVSQIVTKGLLQTGKKTFSMKVPSTQGQSATIGSTVVTRPVQLTSGVANPINRVSSGVTGRPTISTPAVPSVSVGALPSINNQIIKLNGALYTVYQSGDNRYLIPFNINTSAASDLSKLGINPHVIQSGVNTLRLSNPQVITPTTVPQLPVPQVTQLSVGAVTIPQPVTANVLSGPQTNILQAGAIQQPVNQQPVILSSPQVPAVQTILLTIPQKPVPSASQKNVSVIPNSAQSSSQVIGSMQTASQHDLQKNAASDPIKSTAATINTQVQSIVANSSLNDKQINVQASQTASPSLKVTTVDDPPTLPSTSASSTPHPIHIAKPQDIKSSNLHKTGGLFALEVCLDTATSTGTEPLPETIYTCIVQEKETIFVESKEDENSQDTETEKVLSDAEKCKVVITTAMSRGHLMPNDLTSISNHVFFECTRCHACFPLHIQLNLHLKQCSKQAPSIIPKIKIHSPVSVVDEFYKDPTGGRNFMYVYCRFCRARIVRNQQDPSLLVSHLLKHIEPKVELAILPKKHKGSHCDNSPSDCSRKALEWVDYIVPPFTLDNPPISSKNGVLDTYTGTADPALLNLAKQKKKKKKKKKKHKYRASDSDEDYENLAGSRLSSLRPKNARYFGTLRPKETTLHQTVSDNGPGSGSTIDSAGSKPKGVRTMMQGFKHLRSPNKKGSTLTASIPMKSKYRDRERPGESTRRWNNGKTRSQLQCHWRRSSRRFSHLRDRDASTPEDSTPEGSVAPIELSSDEDENHQEIAPEDSNKLNGAFTDVMSNSPVTITEDDISDYVKIIDEAEELQVGNKAMPSSSQATKGGQRQDDSDLVDYYGNDVNSTLSCEPLIMEPEQVICYFKRCSGNVMECQFRSCGSRVVKNIRAMLGHIRVHFQILVPMQLLANCGTQFPKQSIPRPLSLTFTQVQAHFTISDMQEANLHLGEVQQIYTCNWKNCTRSRCYKKSICGHLVKHIFFTLISKEDYQAMAETMSTYSPSTEETVVKKLKIVAVNKAGEKVSLVVAVPISQTKTPELLMAAIKKCLASDKSIKLPPQVLQSIAAKFSAEASSSSADPDLTKMSTENDEPSSLTRAEIDSLWKKFPNLLEKWKMVDVEQMEEIKDTTIEFQDGGDKSMIKERRRAVQKRSKIIAKRWRSVLQKRLPAWSVPAKIQDGELKVVRRKAKDPHKHGKKRKGDSSGSAKEAPPNKKDKVEMDKICDDENTISVSENPVISSDSPVNEKTDSDGASPEEEVISKSEMPSTNEAADLACEKDSSAKNTELDPILSTSSDGFPPSGDSTEFKENKGEAQKSSDEPVNIRTGDITTSTRDSESIQKTDQVDAVLIQDEKGEDSPILLKATPLKTKVVIALTPRQISKVFRFRKLLKNKTVQVNGRGYGCGVFRCRMPQCRYFKEVMTADRKSDLLRTLAMHLADVHLKNHPHRAILLQSGSKKDQSHPKKQVTEHLKDLSTYEDFRKFKLKNMFQRRQMHRTRTLRVDGCQVRTKVKSFHSCLSRKCFFGCFNASRHILITHLQSHLQHLQLSAKKTARPQQVEDFRNSLDESLPIGDLPAANQSQVEEEIVPSTQDIPESSGFNLDASEDCQGLGSDGVHLWEDSTQESTDQCTTTTRDSFSPIDKVMEGDKVLDPTDVPGDEQMDTVDGSHPDVALVNDVDMMDVSDSFRECNDVVEVHGENGQTADDITNEGIDHVGSSDRQQTSTLSSADATGAGDMVYQANVNRDDSLQDQVSALTDCADTLQEAVVSKVMDCGDGPVADAIDASPDAASSSLVSTPLSHSDSIPATSDMDELCSRPGDSIQMFYDELQTYFSCYTVEMKGRKGFGLKHFSCPKCERKNLRGNNLQGHLENHIEKKVVVTPVDNILGSHEKAKCPEDSQSLQISSEATDELQQSVTDTPVTSHENTMSPNETEIPEVSKDHGNTVQMKSESPREDKSNPEELDNQPDIKATDDANTIYLTEDEIFHKYFTKDLNVKVALGFGCEYLHCNQCSFRTLTIMDTPSHIGSHIKKKVILKK